MKAREFYDKEGVGFEIYLHYEKQSIMIQVGDDAMDCQFLELDEDDLDDIIIGLTDLKNDLIG